MFQPKFSRFHRLIFHAFLKFLHISNDYLADSCVDCQMPKVYKWLFYTCSCLCSSQSLEYTLQNLTMCSSWPTFAIVGPNGKLLAQIAGEGRRKVLMTIFKIFKCAYNPFCSRSDYFFQNYILNPCVQLVILVHDSIYLKLTQMVI